MDSGLVCFQLIQNQLSFLILTPLQVDLCGKVLFKCSQVSCEMKLEISELSVEDPDTVFVGFDVLEVCLVLLQFIIVGVECMRYALKTGFETTGGWGYCWGGHLRWIKVRAGRYIYMW